MSVARNSHALRRWQRLSSQLRPSRPFSIYPARLAHTTTATNTNTTTTTPPPKTTRQFHSSPSLDAARSPAARRAQASRVRQPTVSRETPLPPAQGSSDARREFLDANGENLWAEAVKAHVIDEKVDLDTFMRISHELFKRAYTGSPSAQAIWEIDLDADLVYNIGHIASIGEPRFKEWLLTSCALAEARMPTLVCATRYLTQYNSKVKSEPPRTPLLDKVESLALHHRDPIAMTLHAQALGLRGRHNDAIPLIEEVMGAIKPDSNPPTLVNGGFLGGFPLPWDVYEWLKREVGDRDAAMEAVKLAALEYHEPSALVKYANHVLAEKGDLELYEECMSKAASAGHPEACRKLANFYLLTSVGRYPRRGEASAKQPLQANGSGPKRSWLSSLFNRSLSLPDYGKLARGWYRVACLHGSRKAALTFSLLLREKGDYQTGKLYLEMAAMEPELLPAIRGYRVNWDNQELSLVVDYARLEV